MAEWWEEFTAQPAAQPAASGGNWWDAYTADFGDVESGSATAPRPLMSDGMPERTGMEAVSDAATRVRQGLNSVVGGIVAAPVNISNMLITPPHQRALNKALGIPTEDIDQPDFVRGIQESLSVDNELEGQGLSDKAKMQAEQFQNKEGFVDAAKYLLENPSYLATEGAAQIPQFLQLVPGSVVGTVGAQAAGAASQNVQQIEEELRRRGVPEAEIKDRAADAFAQSMVINSALPMLPGGSSFDRLLAGRAEQVVGTGATRFLKPLMGETVTEGLQESGDQVIQNIAQGDDIGQGVGQAAALGTLMGTTTGGIAGGVDLARGDANAGLRQAAALTGQLERDANRIRTPESDAVDAGREAARAIFAEADADVRPDPATIDFTQPVFENREAAIQAERNTAVPIPERKPEKIVQTRLAELEAKPEPTLFEREEMALLQEGKPFDRQALLADLESAPEPELIRNGTRVFYPGDVKAMRAKLAEAGLSEGMRMTGEDGSDVGLYFPAKMQAEVDAVLRPKPAEQAQPEPVKEGELPYRELGIPPPRKPRNRVKSAADFDPNYHDIRDFIALNGGLDAKAFAAEFNSEVPSPAENFRFFGKPLFRKSGGLQPDQLRERLQEAGFLQQDAMDETARYTPQDAYDLVDRALDGSPVFHPDGVDTQNAIQNYRNQNEEIERRQQYIDENGVPPESDEEFARRADALDRGDFEMLYAKRPSVEPFREMTRDEFLGSPKITKDSNAADLKPKQITSLAEVESVPFKSESGALTARYSPDGAAVYDGDKVIASYNFGDTLVVDKNYRRQGIGEELAYQWRTRNPSAKPAETRTKSAQRLQEKVWDRISRENSQSERGIKRSQRPTAQGIEVDEAADLTPEEIAAFNRQTKPKAPERTRPDTPIIADDNVTTGLTGIARNEDAFKHPTSKAKTLPDILRDIEPGYTAAESVEMGRANVEPADTAWNIRTPDGNEVQVYQKGKTVWIDVSNLKQGQAGSRIYNAVANYAHNTGKVFVGDPAGFSEVAQKRRAEQMLSSALKFGTTDHMQPHPKQLEGNQELGIPKLNWKVGDTAHNIRELARVTSEVTTKEFGEIADLSYNPESKRFERPDGTEFTDADFTKLAERGRADAETAVMAATGRDANALGPSKRALLRRSHTAGVTTLKRAVIARQLASPEGGKLAGVLAGIGERGTEYPAGKSLPNLKRVLYSKTDKTAPKTARLTADQVKAAKADAESRVASHWGRSAVNKLKTRGRVEFITKQEVVDRGLQTMAELDGVDGFFDPESGKAYVIADSGAQSADLPGVLSHEVFHANAEQFLGSDGFKRLKEAFRKLKNRDKDIAAAYKRVPSDTSAAHVDEEGIAYLAQEAPKHRLSERLTDEAKLFLNRLGIPLDWLNAHAAAVRKIAALNLKDAGNRGRVARFTKDGVKYQKVFHGTPHRGIEKEGFKLQKIGTGEGAQAYGWGMYFAGLRDVAEAYRQNVKDMGRIRAANEEMTELAKVMEADEVRGQHRKYRTERGREAAARYDELLRERDAVRSDKGQLYSAEIPEDSDLLDWDKPLSEQPENVRAALDAADFGGDEVIAAWKRNGAWEHTTGETLYRRLAGGMTRGAVAEGKHEAASHYLNSIGIPGLRYLDGSSRKDGDGSHNYVIWDENLLTPEKAQITPYYSKRDKPKPKVTGARPEELIEVRKQISSFKTLIKCLGG